MTDKPTGKPIVRDNLHVRNNLQGRMWRMANAKALAEYLREYNTEPLRYEVEGMEVDNTMGQIKVYDEDNNFLGYY